MSWRNRGGAGRWSEEIADVAGELCYAARTLRKTPGLLGVLVLCLGLGVGVNTIVFNILNATVLRQPTAAAPDRIVRIELGNSNQISYPNFADLRPGPAFEGFALVAHAPLNLRGGTDVEPIAGLQTSFNFFELIGVEASAGRTYAAADSSPGGSARVAILDHDFWTQRFAADPQIIGRPISLNGTQFTIIGILPRGFQAGMGLYVPQVYVPIGTGVSAALALRGRPSFELRGRLAPGVSREEARVAFLALARQLEARYPEENRGLGRGAVVLPLAGLASLQRSGIPSEAYLGMSLPFAICGLLLLIACANVAGVLLAKGISRQREIAVRLALGASRWRVIRLLMSESVLLAFGAIAGGLLLTAWVAGTLQHTTVPGLAMRLPAVRIDLNLVLYLAAVTLLICLLSGFVPALQVTRMNLTPGLRDEVFAGGRSRRRLRKLLVIGQVSASVFLLTICLLLLRSLMQVATADRGFDAGHNITARITLDGNRFTPEQRDAFAEAVVAKLEALPQIEAASYANLIPLGGNAVGRRALLQDRPSFAGVRVWLSSVGPRYFETMGMAVARGREFRREDDRAAPPVVIVNEQFARATYPNEEALGRRIRVLTHEPDAWREIVGVVPDNKYAHLSEPPQPQVFLPYRQTGGALVVQARTAGLPSQSLDDVRRAITAVDETVLVQVASTIDATSMEVTIRRLLTIILTSVGGLGLLLSMIGLFGVLAWEVNRRTAEIGIRLALGAPRRSVRKLIVRDAVRLVSIGLVFGLAAAFALTFPLRMFLAGYTVADPLTVGAVAGTLLVVSGVASWVPTRRATSVDPMIALRRQ